MQQNTWERTFPKNMFYFALFAFYFEICVKQHIFLGPIGHRICVKATGTLVVSNMTCCP